MRATIAACKRAADWCKQRGVELDFRWLTPLEPLSVWGAAAYTLGKFTSFPEAPAVASSGQDTQDLTGRRMPFVPRGHLNFTPELRIPFAAPGLARLESRPANASPSSRPGLGRHAQGVRRVDADRLLAFLSGAD